MPLVGTIEAALSTKVLPVTMASGIIHPNGIIAGKLNGAMIANGPSGSRMYSMSTPVPMFSETEPFIVSVTAQACSMYWRARRISPPASSRFLPFSSTMTRASSARASHTRWR